MNLQFQQDAFRWACLCFGDDSARNAKERTMRFIEEALEFAQTTGLTRDDALALVEHVFSRTPGRIGQELGGTMTTLAVLSQLIGYDAEYCGRFELDRNIANTESIRAKWLKKPEEIKAK